MTPHDSALNGPGWALHTTPSMLRQEKYNKKFCTGSVQTVQSKKTLHRHPEARGCAAAEPRRATARAGPLILRGSAFGRAPQDDGLSLVIMDSGPATDL